MKVSSQPPKNHRPCQKPSETGKRHPAERFIVPSRPQAVVSNVTFWTLEKWRFQANHPRTTGPVRNPPKRGNSTQLKVLLCLPGHRPHCLTSPSEPQKNEGFNPTSQEPQNQPRTTIPFRNPPKRGSSTQLNLLWVLLQCLTSPCEPYRKWRFEANQPRTTIPFRNSPKSGNSTQLKVLWGLPGHRP